MKKEFLLIANELNKIDIVPLLYGSLGLEQRLHTNLNADDIDVLIPEIYFSEVWYRIADIMVKSGYLLYDINEHAFEKNGLSIAFATIESLAPFADVDVENIPVIKENGIYYKLLDLHDYLKVYTASLKDGYRKNKKNKNDKEKIDLINKALSEEH